MGATWYNSVIVREGGLPTLSIRQNCFNFVILTEVRIRALIN